MPITAQQSAAAQLAQIAAAQDNAPQVRLIAGPGTGKSAAIERRVAHVLNAGANPDRVFVISFTRATCAELRSRINSHCSTQPCAQVVNQVRVSTMHALALRILRSAAVLATLYPSDPMILDDWEKQNVYDAELAKALGCTPSRAEEVRLAHDARWQTLNPQSIAQAAITPAEQTGFNAFHATRRNLYSCVLLGELIYECVVRIQQGAIQLNQLPPIDHLIVDEYQDLNACDQEFIRLLVAGGATLFVAGDDDQSIYSFRHANPNGIVQFNTTYPAATHHTLSHCFRCCPAIVTAATNLVAHNPNRLPKQLISLYATATPPLTGRVNVWSFANATAEARAIAQSCQSLIGGGLAGQEDQIVILVSNRRLQLPRITQELSNLGLPFDAPGGSSLRDNEAIRAAYSIMRIAIDRAGGSADYVAHRSLLAQLHGVGLGTSKRLGDECVANAQNFHDLFVLAQLPHWLSNRTRSAAARVQAVIGQTAGWSATDTIGARVAAITHLLTTTVFNGSGNANLHANEWNVFASTLPQGMTLEEVLGYLAEDSEVAQRQLLDAVGLRLGLAANALGQQRSIRVLTMHGAKGLSGKVVFIPSAEQGIMPSFRAIHAVGLLNEQRRLFYVSMTRAKAVCIVSHATLHTGADAFLIRSQPQVRLPRSQFLNEAGVQSTNRLTGLTPAETAQIVAELGHL